ncbi:MAG: helix-turn-helix transcriptional regulator [Sphingomonadaceae bacterium]|nr:helix-turn-helix transcriptional regulator [Sphingomonadaceae bacterium]
MSRTWYELNESGGGSSGEADPVSLLSKVLDRAPRAILVANPRGKLVHANEAGAALLKDATLFRKAAGRLEVVGAQAESINAALAAAADPQAPRATCLLVRGEGDRPRLLSVGTLSGPEVPPHVLIFLHELPIQDGSLGQRLQMLFGLTRAEQEVAIGIANGRTPREIAGDRGVSEQTVRVQLKTLSRKLGCRRQTEIAALVRSILPLNGYGKS